MLKLKNIVTSFFLIFTLSSEPLFAASYSGDELTNINVYEHVSPAIVAVDADIDDGVSSGTGCIIDTSGIILTSKHVLEGQKKIMVTLSNGKKYAATLLTEPAKHDFVLIKINPEGTLPVIKLGDSSRVKVGQKVLAIGNPFGFDRSLTEGIISRIDKTKNKIQTDAAINPGCSGGPLLNTDGEVIGINQSIYNPDNNKSNIGIGFAIPVNSAKNFISEVKKLNLKN
jgi:serine protease Do